ncbi:MULTISPECIES: hypothetical protein [Streptomyces]|uniref:Uncharacterized protein n=1 Tax=Streptomyces eurythermus TaxID=42237 RepID=A0ABW6ZBW1_9ACTN|nr:MULTISPECIES: hypothetical protein [Streptomyces]QIS74963.1 hypothetical protein HB370_37420 [Streptomyces sp. DSM 40868]
MNELFGESLLGFPQGVSRAFAQQIAHTPALTLRRLDALEVNGRGNRAAAPREDSLLTFARLQFSHMHERVHPDVTVLFPASAESEPQDSGTLTTCWFVTIAPQSWQVSTLIRSLVDI